MLLLTSLHLTSTPLDKEDCYQRVRMLAGGEINDSFMVTLCLHLVMKHCTLHYQQSYPSLSCGKNRLKLVSVQI